MITDGPFPQQIDPKLIVEPVGGRVSDEDHALIREFDDLADCGWDDVAEALSLERRILERYLAVGDAFYESAESEFGLSEDWTWVLHCLDVGMASAVLALNAARCPTVTSCNGLPDHLESHPLIVFRSPLVRLPTVLEAAEVSSCGVINAERGMLMLRSHDPRRMFAFADYLYSRRESLSPLPAPLPLKDDDDAWAD